MQLRLSCQALTESEQGLGRALLRPHPGDLQNLVQRHVAAPAWRGRLRKCAVAAMVPAEPGQRYEHLRSMRMSAESPVSAICLGALLDPSLRCWSYWHTRSYLWGEGDKAMLLVPEGACCAAQAGEICIFCEVNKLPQVLCAQRASSL